MFTFGVTEGRRGRPGFAAANASERVAHAIGAHRSGGGLAAWTALRHTHQREVTPGVAPTQPHPGETVPRPAFEVVADGTGQSSA